jgi:hypothetical protein
MPANTQRIADLTGAHLRWPAQLFIGGNDSDGYRNGMAST